MNARVFRPLVPMLVAAACSLLVPAERVLACEPARLVEALAQAGNAVPKAVPRATFEAARLEPAELARLPVLARTESLLGRVGVPLAWHRIEVSGLEAAAQAGGGTLIVARIRAEGAEPECEAWVAEGSRAQATESSPLLALLPVGEGLNAEGGAGVQGLVQGMLADFRLAMRVGGQYAPRGAWVVAPWVSQAALYRSVEVAAPVPGLPPGRADTRVRASMAGLGLTRGLTRDTSLTLLLAGQQSALDTVVNFPAMGLGPLPQPPGRQHDTLVGLEVHSVWLRENAALPAVLFNGRAFADSTHSRASGSAAVSALYDLGQGWGVAATLGADAERPESGSSRQGRSATLGASVQLSPRWMATVDAGRREVRELQGSQSVQRLRVYHSLASLSYVALVMQREGSDRRVAVTFVRPL